MVKINNPTVFNYSPAIASKTQNSAHKDIKESDKEASEVLDFLASNPITLAAKSKIQCQKQEVDEEEDEDDDFEKFLSGDDNPFERGEAIPYEQAPEKLRMVRNPVLKQIGLNLAKGNFLDDKCLELIETLSLGIEQIDDKKVLDYVNKKLKNCPDMRMTIEHFMGKDEVEEDADGVLLDVYAVVNAYNSLAGKSSAYKKFETKFGGIDEINSNAVEYLKYIKSKNPGLYENFLDRIDKAYKDGNKQNCGWKNLINLMFRKGNINPEDFIEAVRTEPLKDLCMRHNEDKIADYLYEEYYLKNSDIPNEIKQKCLDINDEYKTKIFFSDLCSDISESEAAVFAIEEELQSWKDAYEDSTGSSLKMPIIIDFNQAQIPFLRAAEGFANSFSGRICLNGDGYSVTKNALRHEIMHLNFNPLAYVYDSGFSYSALAQNNQMRVRLINDIIKHKTVIKDGKKTDTIDFANCKYREEFLNAGIDYRHIEYAYKNEKEFVSVAAEGDFTKYSPEFKEVLNKIGMPQATFRLGMTNFDTYENVKKIELVRKNNPEVTDFDELCDLVSKVEFSDDEVEILSDEFFSC